MKRLLSFGVLCFAACNPAGPEPVSTAPPPDPSDEVPSPDPEQGETGTKGNEGAGEGTELVQPSTDVPPVEIIAKAGDCPPLPKLQSKGDETLLRATELATVIRSLACEPELYALSSADANKKLSVPEGITIELLAQGARLEVSDAYSGLKSTALAQAMGIQKPVAQLEWQAYHDHFWLGSSDSGEFDLWGPGKVRIGIKHDADRDDPFGKVVPLTDDMPLRGIFSISMPETAIKLGDDPEGLAQLAAAMKHLANEAEMLAKEPDEVAKLLEMEGERWALARTSLSRPGAEESLKGISIDPRRTIVPADGLMKALGFPDAKASNVNREHDVWEVSDAGGTNFSLGDAVVSIRVDVADGSNPKTTLEGATVEFISLLPQG